MHQADVSRIVADVRALVKAHYLDPAVAAEVSRVLADGLSAGRYPADPPLLADAVTADLQSINADRHLRLLYHAEAQAPRAPGDDAEERAALARWAARTCSGVACVQRLAGHVGYLDMQPILFPAALGGTAITAAVSLLAGTDALIIDLRQCRGGEPAMVTFLVSYLWGPEPVQLTGLREGRDGRLTQAWTLPYVPGQRFGPDKPLYVLTSAATFSGGEQLAYDLQQLGRASVVGERTRGGAHAREGFIVHPHLEATISTAAAVSPRTGGNWEGTGVTPDIQVTAADARDTAYRLALQRVIAAEGAAADEARAALAAMPPAISARADPTSGQNPVSR
jgi:hypothetical protein